MPSFFVFRPHRDDQLRELFDFMAEPNRGDSASARMLCEVVDEWLKVGHDRCLYL